ncbi:MAG: peptidase U32 family protein [Candidatus Aenigmatarchaeota archaeon]
MVPELLAPAGNWASLRAAVDAGADAVYLGLNEMNLRANAGNFEESELMKVVEFCHGKNVKVYLTLNSIVFDDEAKKIDRIFSLVKTSKVDAIIAWDLMVIQKAIAVGIPVHVSTQASVANIDAVHFFEKLGVKRINLARECSLKQINAIKKKVSVEIECFAHGAMCVSISGRCFVSQFLTGHSANRGECIQQCRRTYTVKDNDTGYELGLENDRIMSPKDLCTIPILDKIIASGVTTLKIEGRVRPPEYVKVVTSVYRQAIDAIASDKYTNELKEKLIADLRTVYSKKFSTGFYLGSPTDDDWTGVGFSDSVDEKNYAGMVEGYFQKISVAKVRLHKTDLSIGDKIIIIGESTGVVMQIVGSLQKNREDIKIAKKGMSVGLKVSAPVHRGDKVFVMRRRK